MYILWYKYIIDNHNCLADYTNIYNGTQVFINKLLKPI